MPTPEPLEPPTPPGEPSVPADTPKRPLPVQAILISIGVALSAAAIAYGVGRAQGNAETKEVRTVAEQLQNQLEERQRSLAATQDKVQLLESRRRLSQALAALEGRNFGTASKKLREAAKTLAAAASDERLEKMAKELQAFQLVATENIGEQRDRIVAWMAGFDAAVPPAQ